MMLGAAPGLLRQMTLHQQSVDVFICIPSSALVNRSGPLPQGQGRDPIVLGNDNIPPVGKD